ncbi:MAG TPA: tRNA 2-thiouridine(34) synthase MnmA [Gammaproteobacteria bacterium]|nr:tRNA 2-thiouridine(34) synthase MnmA [Gammaproteobacteria bacterium]
MKHNNSKIMIGMSGGVDSSVAALLLLEKGFRVEGLFMKNWEEDDTDVHCSAEQDLGDAASVCKTLGIPLHTVNFSSEYWNRVFEYFLAEYKAGRTPNPDIMCNKEIKFKAFLDYSLHLGADAIATGHYARIEKQGDLFLLKKGSDQNKDQSYFLYMLGQHPLGKSLFPVGELEKQEVRSIAEKNNFTNFSKKDSTGICFIGERNFRNFLQNYIPAQPGDIVTPEGKRIGTHQGLMYHTLGQRQGLGIGGSKDGSGEPWYVIDKDMKQNRLIVGQGHNHPLLYKSELVATDLHWVSGFSPDKTFTCMAKTRYRQPDQLCKVDSQEDNGVKVDFDSPQRAITPGQSVVFYQDDNCLGGGVIL